MTKPRIAPLDNPSRSGYNKVSSSEQAGVRAAMQDGYGDSILRHGSLPSFVLHGHPPPGELQGDDIDTRGRKLRLSTGEGERGNSAYVSAADPSNFEALLKSDLYTGHVDLTRFVTQISWQSLTEAPYSNAAVTLSMPAYLANFVLHGRVERIDEKQAPNGSQRLDTTGFRVIEAGGWCSIRLPQKGQLAAEAPAVFFGRIIGVEVKTMMDGESGLLQSTVSLTCASFLYPYMVSEHRRAVKIEGKLKAVDRAAIHGSIVMGSGKKKKLVSSEATNEASVMFAAIEGLTDLSIAPSELLSKFVQRLGHFYLPSSLTGPVTVDLIKLGNNLTILNGDPVSLQNTPYTLASSYMDSIDGAAVRPEPRYLVQSIVNANTNMWDAISSIFKAQSPLIELFPVLIPLYTDVEDASTPVRTKAPETLVAALADDGQVITGQNGSTQYEVTPPISKEISPLARQLRAVPAIMYRYKPLPPDFDISNNSLGEGGRFGRTRVGKTPPYSQRYFGRRDHTKDLKPIINGYRYFEIDSRHVIGQSISWHDTKRINAVHVAPSYVLGELADGLLFGTGCTPVLDVVDINRNGLRMLSTKAPFYDFAKSKKKLKAGEIDLAASAHAERLYYTVGDGHMYGSGNVQCTYLNDPTLVCGVWVKINYGTGDYFRPMTGYLVAVTHTIEMDQTTGLPQASTNLNLERVSYGSVVPSVTLSDAPAASAPPARPQNPERKSVRRKTVPQTPPPIAPVSLPNQPSASTSEQSAAPELPADLRDTSRPAKVLPATQPAFTPEDPTVPNGAATVAPTSAPVQAAAERPAAQPSPDLAAFDVSDTDEVTPFAYREDGWRVFTTQRRQDSQYDEQGRLLPASYRLDMWFPYNTTEQFGISGNTSLRSLNHLDDVEGYQIEGALQGSGDRGILPRCYSFRFDQSTVPNTFIDNVQRVTDRDGGVLQRAEVIRSLGAAAPERGWIGLWNRDAREFRIEYQDGSFGIVAVPDETQFTRLLSDAIRLEAVTWVRVAFIGPADAAGSRQVRFLDSRYPNASALFSDGVIK